MIAIVGAGTGSLIGLLIAYLGVGNIAVIACGAAGAILPFAVLGEPGRDSAVNAK